MKILVTGATGFIGGHVAHALQAAGHDVVAVSRSNGHDFSQLCDPADWRPLLKGVDVAINCVGIIAETRGQRFSILHTDAPVALFNACVEAGVSRVIQVSALGADEHAFVPYQLTKKAADDVLRKLPLGWFILRPSLVYGDNGSSTIMFRKLASLPVLSLPGGGKQRIQPVHVDDLVATVLRCLNAEVVGRTIDVVGPTEMTMAEWLQRLRQQKARKPAVVIPVPMPLVKLTASVGRFVIPMLHPDNLRMLERGNTADVQPLTDFLGRPPRDVP